MGHERREGEGHSGSAMALRVEIKGREQKGKSFTNLLLGAEQGGSSAVPGNYRQTDKRARNRQAVWRNRQAGQNISATWQ